MTVERKTLVIERLPEGGYVVAPLGHPNMDQRPVFAAFELEDVLDFVSCQFEPQTEEPQSGGFNSLYGTQEHGA